MTSRRFLDDLIVLATLAFSVACAVVPLIDMGLLSDLPAATAKA